VVSLLPGPLSRREVPAYLLDRRLGGPHSNSGCCGETETSAFTGNRTPVCRLAPKALKGNDFFLHELGIPESGGIAPRFLQRLHYMHMYDKFRASVVLRPGTEISVSIK